MWKLYLDFLDPSSRRLPKPLENFKAVQINDLTIDTLRQELTDVTECDKLPVIQICPARHGGLLDYPKMATMSSATVMEKWQHCYYFIEKESLAAAVKSGPSSGNASRAGAPSDGSRSLGESQISEDYEEGSLEEFSAVVLESARKLLIHHGRLTEHLVQANKMEKLAVVSGGIAIIRNQLWLYQKIFPEQDVPLLMQLYRECCELLEAMCEQMTVYHSTNLTTIVLQDSESQDWEDAKPYHEGTTVSCSVQMWWFAIESTRKYMSSCLPPSMTDNILMDILNDSLGVLVNRYCCIKPTDARLNQYVCDIRAILLGVSELLFSLSPSIPSILEPIEANNKLTMIHKKCDHLMTAIVMVGTPVVLLKSVLEHLDDVSVRKKRPWIQLIRQNLYDKRYKPSGGLVVEDTREMYLSARLLTDKSAPAWHLVIKLCHAANLSFGRNMFVQFGSFVPNVQVMDVPLCGQSFCSGSCLGKANDSWPILVAEGILWVLMYLDSESSHYMIEGLENMFGKFRQNSWDCLNKTNVGNIRKPVWVLAIQNIMAAHFSGAVEDTVINVDDGVTWTLAHIPKAISILLENLKIVAETLPLPLAGLISYIKDVLPEVVKPICDSVVIQFVLASLYHHIQELVVFYRKKKIQSEKVNFLQALSESLCEIEPCEALEELEKIIMDRLSEIRISSPSLPKVTTSSNTEELHNKDISFTTQSELIARDLLQEKCAVLPMTALYRFVCYNVDWLPWLLDIQGFRSNRDVPIKMKPWEATSHPVPQPGEIIKGIGYVPFDKMCEVELPWDDWVTSLPYSHARLRAKLFQHRPAFQPEEAKYLKAEEVKLHEDLVKILQDLFLTEKKDSQ